MTEPLLEALRRAVDGSPLDPVLRLHLAETLLAAGRADEAIAEVGVVLQQRPADPAARALMARALRPAPGPAPDGYDWSAAEQQVGDLVPPMFVRSPDAPADQFEDLFEVEAPRVTLADVGGMTEVKKRLDAAFLAPRRNPELRRLYGKNLSGGLLLYGPPGCGKTYLARAVAGELGASFLSVGISDVLDMYLGSSERNLAAAFAAARRRAPCVLFFDEIDALGQRRSAGISQTMRTTVNQLLSELDGVDADNAGVFVLAATNQPWDVDPALRRPGRFDRTLLVLPPDLAARAAIFRTHLAGRPVAGIDLEALARATDGLSGADIAYVCELAAEGALLDSAASGHVRMIGMPDLLGARQQVRPSIGPWLDAARNVVLFANQDGTYDELRQYLKKTKRL